MADLCHLLGGTLLLIVLSPAKAEFDLLDVSTIIVKIIYYKFPRILHTIPRINCIVFEHNFRVFNVYFLKLVPTFVIYHSTNFNVLKKVINRLIFHRKLIKYITSFDIGYVFKY